jgi:putative nucleotidyltransferase with HDIG domain
MSTAVAENSRKRTLFFALLGLVAIGLSFIALVIPQIAPLSSPSIQVGQVAPQEILAPQDITYPSEVITEQRRESAASAVPPIYTAADTSIARQQLENLRAALAYITSVRSDGFSTSEQKLADLAALENIHLTQETASSILALSDSRWQAVQQEAIVVLEQVMRNTIREDRLDDALQNIPAMVSLSLPEDQAAIVGELVSAFVVPNSFYSESLTEDVRQRARDAVEPVSRSYKAGETVVQRGQVITDTILEALQVMGLVQPQYDWRDLVSIGAIVLLVMIFMLLYLRRNARLMQDIRGLTLIVILFLAFLVGARLIIPADPVILYIFPLAAYSLIVAVLFGQGIAMVTTFPLAILVTYGLPNSLELILYYTLGGYFGVLALGRASRLTSFFAAGGAIAICGTVITLIFNLPHPISDWIVIATLSGAALLNGLASASLAVLLQFFLAQFLGMTTALQLMEISRPDHPLLQHLLRTAPGTYQHSLQVANLAEQAAERIDADTLLTRVGALYHDIGKTVNPMFFIENQAPGSPNPHDELEPLPSAQIIINHVTDGLDLARKYRLPGRIQDFILEHHGTMITRYQYTNAVKAVDGDEEQVDQEQFRYPGPRPRSRETAILMLADGSEARVRAERPEDKDKISELVKQVIQNRLTSGQLDETDLTLRDLDAIADSFTSTLRGMYHPRIEYPQLEKPSLPATDPTPTQPIGVQRTQEASLKSQSDSPSPTSETIG